MDHALKALLVFFFIVAGVAILGNLFVLYKVHSFKSCEALVTYLLYYLHLSSAVLCIACLPLIYRRSTGLCQFIGFFHYYCGLFNMGITVLMTIMYYNMFVLNNPRIDTIIRKYCVKGLALFCFITLLPFSTNSYGTTGELWCSLSIYSQFSNLWAFLIFYIWIILGLCFCIFLFGYICYYFSKHEVGIDRKSLFSSIGIYILISILSYIPRVLPRIINLISTWKLDEVSLFFFEGLIYFVSIGYIVIFYYNESTFRSYEDFRRRETSITSAGYNISLEDIMNHMHSSLSSSFPSFLKNGNDFEKSGISVVSNQSGERRNSEERA
jgi:hypothetical protein